MKTVYKVRGLCSCGCGETVERETTLYSKAACKVRASQTSKKDVEYVEYEAVAPVRDALSGVVESGEQKKPKGNVVKPTGYDPIKEAEDFIKSRGYAGICKHGSAIGLCKHGCKE